MQNLDGFLIKAKKRPEVKYVEINNNLKRFENMVKAEIDKKKLYPSVQIMIKEINKLKQKKREIKNEAEMVQKFESSLSFDDIPLKNIGTYKKPEIDILAERRQKITDMKRKEERKTLVSFMRSTTNIKDKNDTNQ